MKRRLKAKPAAAPLANEADPAAAPRSETARRSLPLPSTDPATNFVITDIMLRAAGDFAREAIERKTLTETYDRETAEKIVSSQSIAKTIALYGITRIATRSPVGLAVVAGGLALKALYDRGKSIEPGKASAAAKPRRFPRFGKKG